MQTLFVLGSIGESFEVNGLNHFPMDIERTIEKSDRRICRAGSAVFQAGGQIVAVLEVLTDEHLPSIVPLTVNAVLSEHQVVIDVITFVARGYFPRSRLGEKQRGKILSHWVTRKLRTIEQFTVRDPEDEIRNSDSLQDLSGLRIEDGTSNGHVHGHHSQSSIHRYGSVSTPRDSASAPSARLLIEDGSMDRPTRTNSGRMF